MSRMAGVSQGAILEVLRRVCETNNITQGLREFRLKMNTSKEGSSACHEGEQVSLTVQDQSGAHPANWTLSAYPKTFSSS